MPRQPRPLTYEKRQALLWLLHENLIKQFLFLIENPPAEGNKASLYGVIRDFLKDNEIQGKFAGRRSMKQGLTKMQQDMEYPFDS